MKHLETIWTWIVIVASIIPMLFCDAQTVAGNLEKHTIAAPGINVSYIGYGARMTNLFVNDKNGMPRDIVLGYDNASDYIYDTEHAHTYFGATGE